MLRATGSSGPKKDGMILKSLEGPLAAQNRVIGALVLRDLRTRFGRTFVGFLIIIGWPLTHLLVLMVIYYSARQFTPAVGSDPALFLGTGILPYILFCYPARMIMYSLHPNKSLLAFPIIKPDDIIFARCIVEVITAFWVTAIFTFMLFLFGVDVMPVHTEDALGAIFATIFLGVAVGWFGAVMFALFRAWVAFQVIGIIVMYFTAGVFIPPTSLPEKIRELMWYNPLLHSVEWLRSAYYEGYGYGMLDQRYLLGYALVTFVAALAIGRGIRGRLLMQ
jgi:capsular polysaccharide transport system permease protein